MTQVQKDVKNLTLEWNQKQQHFFPHALTSFLFIWFVVAICSGGEAYQRLWPILAPTWIRPCADLAEKQQHL